MWFIYGYVYVQKQKKKTKKQFCVAFAKATQTRVSSNIFRKIYMNSCKTHTCAHVVARTFVRLYVAPLSSGADAYATYMCGIVLFPKKSKVKKRAPRMQHALTT